MKLATKLMLLISLLAAIASAQTTFQHIIIVVQENRSVDNLFGESTEPGLNISSSAKFNQPGVGEVPSAGRGKFERRLRS